MGRDVRLWHRCRGIANGKWDWLGVEVCGRGVDFNRTGIAIAWELPSQPIFVRLIPPYNAIATGRSLLQIADGVLWRGICYQVLLWD